MMEVFPFFECNSIPPVGTVALEKTQRSNITGVFRGTRIAVSIGRQSRYRLIGEGMINTSSTAGAQSPEAS